MKISEMTTKQAASVLVRIADPVASIMHDDETATVLAQLANTDASDGIKFVATNLPIVVNVLLGKHEMEVYEIVGVLSGKTSAEVAKQKISETLKDIKNCLDGELFDFFASSR